MTRELRCWRRKRKSRRLRELQNEISWLDADLESANAQPPEDSHLLDHAAHTPSAAGHAPASHALPLPATQNGYPLLHAGSGNAGTTYTRQGLQVSPFAEPAHLANGHRQSGSPHGLNEGGLSSAWMGLATELSLPEGLPLSAYPVPAAAETLVLVSPFEPCCITCSLSSPNAVIPGRPLDEVLYQAAVLCDQAAVGDHNDMLARRMRCHCCIEDQA